MNIEEIKMNEERIALELKNITKIFPGVKALSNVSLKMREGEVHALMGENGAGKSTLIRILSGVHAQDEGTVSVFGEQVHFNNPREAFFKGINVVHQERNLVPTFSVAENILLEKISEKAISLIDREKIFQEAQEFMNMVGLDISPRQRVENLSAGQKQMIEIAKALSSRAKIILLDEPTASLSLKEADALLAIIRQLKKQGVSFLYVSHKLEEVFQIADMVTVLRDGQNAGPEKTIKELDRSKLIEMMVGRTQNIKKLEIRNLRKEAVLEVNDLSSKKSPMKNSFKLYKGEILGWYGLVGAGRTELAKALIGAEASIAGEVLLNGKMVKIRSVAEAIKKARMVYVTENRQEEGLFLSHSITRNVAASMWKKICNRFFMLDLEEEKKVAEYYKQKLEIRTPSIEQLVANLSGGNKQKVCIAKGLSVKPEILIFDEPTVGIDIKTKSEIHDLISNLAYEGISIIVISSDMPEIVQLVDRILVFKNGQICGELQNCKDYDPMSRNIMDHIFSKI
ncbi:sugar ABC transporter ATP-binding protein [Desulfosporosinus sp. BICA1-9]|uniref:sugar ABC transporter ATP-binding protein n=1 Tax=Desulfosporosinus sp. BICA1-9 TaxID=1531958 RepID=UPI000B0A58D1|nr:sugar ABC transporter ATP-binding protein [Desulfosporosinus sp. BICA1-9]